MVSAYRDFSIRYLLYSEILKSLLQHYKIIVILVKDCDVEFYRRKFAHPKIFVEPVFYGKSLGILKGTFFARLLVILRKCFAGGKSGFRNSTTDSRVFLYRKEFANLRWRYRLSLELILSLARIAEKSQLIRRLILNVESMIYPGTHYDHYFEKYRPTIVVTSSLGYMIDPFLMRAARRKAVRCVSVIHSWDNTSTKDYRGASPDKVIVWNSIMAREVEVFHDIDPQNIFVGGIAHWDSFFRDLSEDNEVASDNNVLHPFSMLGCDGARPIIYYGTSSYKIFPDTRKLVGDLVQAIDQGRISGRPQLVIRLHPSYLYESASTHLLKFEHECARLAKEFPSILFLDLPRMPRIEGGVDMPIEDMQRHIRMLEGCSVLLTEYSTLMIEAAILDKPIVNIGFGRYRDTDKSISYLETFTHIKRIIKTGACRNTYSFEQLCDGLSRYLERPTEDQEQRRKLVMQEVEMNAGKAGETVGNYLAGIV